MGLGDTVSVLDCNFVSQLFNSSERLPAQPLISVQNTGPEKSESLPLAASRTAAHAVPRAEMFWARLPVMAIIPLSKTLASIGPRQGQ